MEFVGGCSGSGASGDHHEERSDSQRKKKRYHRHTAHQIQRLESTFNECPHPDEKQRLQLSRELGLAPRQIKFWFQNRRTQKKGQQERTDNSYLRSENDKIRCENIAMREALKNIICPSCGGPPIGEDNYFDEQKLRMENLQLKEELDRVSSIAAKYIGRPITQLPPAQPIHLSSLDLSMGSFGGQGLSGPSLDLDLLSGSTSSVPPNLPIQAMGVTISDMDKSLMAEIAASALEELLRLVQTDDPLWMKSPTDGRDILNLETYERIFPRANGQLKSPNTRIEASRDSGVVIMSSVALVDMFMNSNKWMELFPTMVSMARTTEVISSGGLGTPSGTLLLMHEELMVLSPLVATREFYFLRCCQQIEQELWAVVDVSCDFLRGGLFGSQCRSHRLPSGCLIQDMPNGYSKVTWIEHVEIEDKAPTHQLFRDLIQSGFAFGAERWLATLQRMCERFACLMVSSTSTRELTGGIPSPEGKRSLMKLAQRLVQSFCATVSTSNFQRCTTLAGLNDVRVQVAVQKNSEGGQPNGVVLSASTTIWIPISPQNVFNFFKDERTRPQWDVLSNGNAVQEVAHVANGLHSGNCISVLRALNTRQNNRLMLQESCIDSSGSLVVYSPVDLPSINLAMSGDDPSYIPLLPSGFTILPDGRPDQPNAAGASTSLNTHGNMSHSRGSLLTVVFQILVSSLPSAKLNMESVTTVNNLMGNTIQQIKAALNCSGS